MPSQPKPTIRPPSFLWVLLPGVLLSGLAIWHVGRLGFQFEDLSIVFDGGYRLWLGQRPYVDFMAPSGLVLYLQQALCFSLFGVGLGATWWHATVLNAVAGALVWRLLWQRGIRLAVLGTLATWCWFFLPPGAPYIDTTAFFWTLVGFCALAHGRRLLSYEAPSISGIPWPSPSARTRPPWRCLLWLGLAGTAGSLAILTKQNIGGLAVAGLSLLLCLDLFADRRPGHFLRSVVAFAAGLALPWLLLAIYLTAHHAWPNFQRYFFEVPAASGRLKMLLPWGARMVIKAFLPEAVQSTFAYMLGPALRELAVYGLSALLARRWWTSRDRRQRFWLASCVFLLLLQQWSYNTSNNNESLYWPFAGLLFGLVVALLWPRPEGRLEVLVLAMGLLLVGGGYGLSASRQAHDLRPDGLGPPLEHPRLAGLRLYPREGREVAELLTFIDQHIAAGETFLVLGEPSLLYGISGRTPPRGLLWFRDGVSYLADDNAHSDALVSRSLGASELRWVIVDAVGRDRLLKDFPTVRKRLRRDFQLVAEVGAYGVYRRRDPMGEIGGP